MASPSITLAACLTYKECLTQYGSQHAEREDEEVFIMRPACHH